MATKQKILIVVGPTSSGKSALAIELAKKYNGEVISADSRQVYRGLNIGTGKVTKKEMQGVPHHLLDVASPKKKFSAGDFVARATRAITDIAQRDKLSIIAGGTGFYIDALVGRIQLTEVPPNPTLRKQLQIKNTLQLFAILKKKDPARAAMMESPSERNNKVRLIRAVEIASFHKHGSIQEASPLGLSHAFDILWIGINPSFSILEKKIAVRLAQRIKHGMIAEAKRLHTKGLSYKRMEELGLEYRSIARLLQGKITRVEMEDQLNREIRKYAKRQITYWKRNTDIQWFNPKQQSAIARRIQHWLRTKKSF